VRSSELLVLSADGSYTLPSNVLPCPSAPEPVVIQGVWHANARGRLQLAAANAQRLADALVQCDRRITRAKVVGSRHTASVAGRCRGSATPDPARRICGHDTIRMKLRVLGQSVTLAIAERYTGERLDGGEYTPPVASHR
jgi:hypothetical protein